MKSKLVCTKLQTKFVQVWAHKEPLKNQTKEFNN